MPVDDYVTALSAYGLPPEMLWLLRYLFTTVLDGRSLLPVFRGADRTAQAVAQP